MILQAQEQDDPHRLGQFAERLRLGDLVDEKLSSDHVALYGEQKVDGFTALSSPAAVRRYWSRRFNIYTHQNITIKQ